MQSKTTMKTTLLKSLPNESGQKLVTHDSLDVEDPINYSWLLYRTQYIVLDRTMLEAMPIDWQNRFVSLMDEIENEFNFYSENWIDFKYLVKLQKNWQFIENPWWEYRHPNHDYINSIRKWKQSK